MSKLVNTKRIVCMSVIATTLLLTSCGNENKVATFNGKNIEFAEQEVQVYKVYYTDEEEAVNLVKSYFEDWFKYRNIEKSANSNEFKYSDFKVRDNSSSGFTYDSESFRAKYAWSGETNLSNLYGANVLESEVPSDTLSTLSEFKNVKVLWSKDNIMHVGAILTFTGKSNVVGDTATSSGTYYGIVEVVKEEVSTEENNVQSVKEELKIKSINTLAPLVRTSAKQASQEEIDEFVKLMRGEGVSMFEVAYKETALLDKYAVEGKLSAKKKLSEEDIINNISDYYASNEYFKNIALKNYELMKSGVDINNIYDNKDERSLYDSIKNKYSDLVNIEYTPEKSEEIKDIFGSLTINNDTRICLFDSDYYGIDYGNIEKTTNEELLGVTFADSIDIDSKLYSNFDCNRTIPMCDAPQTTKGVLESDVANAIVIKQGYAIVSLKALKSNYKVLKENGFKTEDGSTVNLVGVVTYNPTLEVAIIKIDNDSIEPAVFSDSFEYVWSKNKYGVSKSSICEVGNSRTQVYLPLLDNSSIVYNDKGEVVCYITEKSNACIYDARGVGKSIVDMYTNILNSIAGDIGYVENPSFGGDEG